MKKSIKRTISAAIAAVMSAALLISCANDGTVKVNLDPKHPVTITVWHYYNGALKSAFDDMVDEFNETVGVEKGIIVEGYSHGDVTQLETAVMSAANMEVGSDEIPNVFASYADTAFAIEKMGLLANLDDYFSVEEQESYISSYIEEGRIGADGELKIFPIAKSTEVFMLNQTDFEPFANETGVTYDDLKTKEGLVSVAEKYYNWTDAKTPDILEDGKAFYGRDAMANLFIIAAKEFDVEIFKVENQEVTLNMNKDAMRKIWDYYYVPYINGYFSSYGRFRTDDIKVGNILALTGSTSSAAYFPVEVTIDGAVHGIEGVILPDPVFADAKTSVAVQQGAGMVVSKASREEEYASVVFLKWFTDTETNIEFSAVSGYLPVKSEANDLAMYKSVTEKHGISPNKITLDTIETAFNILHTSEFYTNKAFDGGSKARKILEYNLSDKAVADREQVVNAIAAGETRAEAVAKFDNDDCFEEWYKDFVAALSAVIY